MFYLFFCGHNDIIKELMEVENMKKKLSLFILLSTAFTFLNINKPVITLNAAEDSIPTPVVQYSSQLSETYY